MNIDNLKKIIQEANPEILELKFGCEIKANNSIYKVSRIEGSHIWFDTDVFLYRDEIIDKMILGRPIRLADVLYAINFNKKAISVSSAGAFEEWEAENIHSPEMQWKLKNYTGADLWDFTNDNLDNQSDECKEFLINLLV